MNDPAVSKNRSFVEIVLLLLLFLLLLLALYNVVKVFFGILTFSLIFSVSFNGPFEKLSSLLGNRRGLAAFFYALLLTVIMALPLAGSELNDLWTSLQQKPRETLVLHANQLKMILHAIIHNGIGLIGASLEIDTGIVLSALLLRSKEATLQPVKQMLTHILGYSDASALLEATTQAIKGVSIGVMGTAFIDAVIKPVLMAKSGRLPFLILFIGVIGGLAAWGFTGIFKGAIIIAIAYTIFNKWLERKNNYLSTE
jgi:predicted PurR-regulated permease PerM